jgi:biotin operon repressor
MPNEAVVNELLTFFKALVDPDRLAIAGRLVGAQATIESLSTELDLPRADVQRHLDRLVDSGLVIAAGNTYSIDRDALHAHAKRVLSTGTRVAPPPNTPERILADYLRPNGSLREIPSQIKKKLIIYEHIASQFETGRTYTEKEVNELIKHFHPDVVSIRRDLVDLQFIFRRDDGSLYWRTESAQF